MRNLIRKWLRIDIENSNVRATFESQNDELHERLRTIETKQAEFTLAKDRIENILATFKLPPQERLVQLKGGITILTSFANELQRDIDNQKV